MKESAKQVQLYLQQQGFTNEVVELPSSTRTVQEAAEAIGCHEAQIAKSIVFDIGGRALLIVASGPNRVSEERVATFIKAPLAKANAAFVREHTGYAIGGVPPVAHKYPLRILIDEDLWKYETIWAAAGHPMAVFQLTPDELLQMTKGEVTKIK
ncbi:YbaK/EbsC family protein [Metalysinibacillus jejuensis]|uniref:YbaK/EbsC family protein n=1 Tax=Metalysinibacillus jejuensis TaxID=914327 RepID=UPI000D354D04|nr:YbaK/EbsC family protein [Metalysinibacillus jejuensis]